jgi:hypothetical protein
MLQIEDAAPFLAMDRLEWALGTPLGRDARAWCDRLSRGLVQVTTALDGHTARAESREGWLARVADRDLLRFIQPVCQVCAVCQDHRNLRVAVAGLQALLDDAVRRLEDAPRWLDGAPAAVQLHEVWRLGRELVEVLRAHLRTERCLRGHTEELQHTVP